MIRPSPQLTGSPSCSEAWLDIFRFCSIRDLGASLAVDKHWSTMGNCYHVWADAYDRTQRVDDSSCPSEGPLRSLIQRPFGEDAVGWHVAVLAEDTEGTEGGEDYFNGHIVAYSAETDTYLVAYDSTGEQPFTAWEQERRRRTAAMRHNPSLAGKSRFAFLSPPVRETGPVNGREKTVLGLVLLALASLALLILNGVISQESLSKVVLGDRAGSKVKTELFSRLSGGGSARSVRADGHAETSRSTTPAGAVFATVTTTLQTLSVAELATPGMPAPVEEESAPPSFQLARDLCPLGFYNISDLETCRLGARTLRKRFAGAVDAGHEPSGCLHRLADNDVLFNRAFSRKRNRQRQLICADRIPKLVEVGSQPAVELLLPYARSLFQGCDGHGFFTDREASVTPEERDDFVQVDLPPTQQNRSEKFWLLLKNMVGLLPAWKYLLDMNVTSGMDWVVNLELDHFFVANLLRQTIGDYINLMIQDGLPHQNPWEDPVMLIFGNVFAFNAALVASMKREWQTVGQVISDRGSLGLGCPVISGARAHAEGHCEQDMVYEHLQDVMPLAIVGANGCGNLAVSDSLIPFPLGCWQDFPYGDDEAARLRALNKLVQIWKFSDQEAESYCSEHGEGEEASSGSTAAEMARCDCEEALRPVEVSSWKQELKHNVLHAPTQLWTRLEDHRDEVLFVVFSPCGTRLASCSRDLQTMVFKVSYRLAEPEPSEGEDSQASRPRASPHFELEAIFTHQTAPCRAIWWPIPPYDTVAVSTEDAGAGWQASKVEIWQIGPGDEVAGDASAHPELERLVGTNSRCIFQCHNRPFDIYAAIFPWPPMEPSQNPEDGTSEYSRADSKSLAR
eukprot:g24117.t2